MTRGPKLSSPLSLFPTPATKILLPFDEHSNRDIFPTKYHCILEYEEGYCTLLALLNFLYINVNSVDSDELH